MLRFADSEMEERLRKETGLAPIAPARSHPWISQDVPIRGFVYDVKTGRLGEVFADAEEVTGS
jgi:carbonic anhydrase